MKLPYNEYNEFNNRQMQGQLRRALIVNMLQHLHWNGRQTGQSILQSDSSTRVWRRFDSPCREGGTHRLRTEDRSTRGAEKTTAQTSERRHRVNEPEREST